jgi:hypothetical protein
MSTTTTLSEHEYTPVTLTVGLNETVIAVASVPNPFPYNSTRLPTAFLATTKVAGYSMIAVSGSKSPTTAV